MITIVDKFKPDLKREEADLFKNAVNDETYALAEVTRDLLPEKKALLEEKKNIEDKLKEFDEKVKRQKASKLFIDKNSFLLRRRINSSIDLVNSLIKHLSDNNWSGIADVLRSEIADIRAINVYLSNSNNLDIFYDIGGKSIYDQIRKNNVDSNRTNEELGQIEIREAQWFQFSNKKPKRKRNKN